MAPASAPPVIPMHPGGSWPIHQRYRITELIGSGAFGSVCVAEDIMAPPNQERMVAIKRLGNVFSHPGVTKNILREIAILSKLRHRNVVQILDVVEPSCWRTFNELYIVMELADSDLKKLCEQDVKLTPLMINTVFYNLLVGLSYIHSAGVYHRDLKPANCFVNVDCTIKIGDFNLSRTVEDADFPSAPQPCPPVMPGVPHTLRLKTSLTARVVTTWYRAPELILLQRNYTEAIDVWSAGCIYAELLGTLEGTSYLDRGALFPGRTCFPLSPDHRHPGDYTFHSRSEHDMLNKIFNVIGTPSNADIAEIDRADARRYVSFFAKRDGEGLRTRFPNVHDDMLDLLDRMLRFSAKQRIPVQAALEHVLFAEVRDPAQEKVASGRISLDFDEKKALSKGLLREAFVAEIQKFHPNAFSSIGGLQEQ
eukprot:CAMPEP_0117570040 /NCGR_PEP_ID=MMETSP0784-20121206/58982_1 /TAXON_ID=39447 /ORGANISM="" /LENGTH=422 /DNA_ID=CAMNT_0005368059 /DNA_START=19 /DNA_END=1287 /DNA_ORIENTATION=-